MLVVGYMLVGTWAKNRTRAAQVGAGGGTNPALAPTTAVAVNGQQPLLTTPHPWLLPAKPGNLN